MPCTSTTAIPREIGRSLTGSTLGLRDQGLSSSACDQRNQSLGSATRSTGTIIRTNLQHNLHYLGVADLNVASDLAARAESPRRSQKSSTLGKPVSSVISNGGIATTAPGWMTQPLGTMALYQLPTLASSLRSSAYFCGSGRRTSSLSA